MRILIDTNVILDVLYNRRPFAEASADVLDFCRSQIDNSFVAAHSLTTIYYLYARQKNAETARVALVDLLTLVRVASVSQKVIEEAMRLPYRDFEDAVVMMAAMDAGADFVVTRDLDDFVHGPLPVLTPVELLASL